MTSHDRSGRNLDEVPSRFVVPGEGPLACLLAERLARDDRAAPGATWVHVAYEPGAGLGAPLPESFGSFWRRAVEAEAGAVVVVTSAMTLGPARDDRLPIAEDAPAPDHGGDAVVDHLREVERDVEARRHEPGGPRLHLLRPAVLVGPGLDSPFVRHFAAPRLVVARGVRQAWQFCHVDDLATAVEAAVAHDVPVACVGSPGFLEAMDVTRLSRRRRFELAEPALLSAADRLHRIGVTPTSAESMRYLLHPWPVAVDRLPGVGWRATFDNVEALGVLLAMADQHVSLAGRLVPRREAVGGAAGAAGVTAAALGAAVLVRRARRRSGR